ncbi:MAG TPA: molybdopterin biosynthesis protein [Isosphaeraceae bacterium]|nr:molybdopterin biosynthesis protein [Isosphaeraceae bacterium]
MVHEQEQFLDVVDRDTAERRWWSALRPEILAAEEVPLASALGRVLARDVLATVDVPPFDRSNVDGFAVQAQDTFGAAEETPRDLRINSEELTTGRMPGQTVEPGSATSIATGGVVPRGADAVVMVEHAFVDGKTLRVVRPVAPGAHITFAGTDIARGERILRRGTILTARETGILAAIGVGDVSVVQQPRVGILSTGDEIVAPGEPLRPAAIYDANSTMIADAVRELGAQPIPLGIVGDVEDELETAIAEGLAASDLLLLSGGTSKGAGDLSYRVLARRDPGIIVHGVALKPGKPICLGAAGRKPVVILPGFPTSAIFTLHEFVAPLIRFLGGRRVEKPETTTARMPFRYNSEIGRTEYLLVNLVQGPDGLSAYPLGKGSGSVTTFSQADGFLTIPRSQEFVEAGETVSVVAMGRGLSPADLVVIGSHCTGIDLLLGILNDRGFTSKTIWVGSQGGLAAVARGECDLAGIHLLDAETNQYNRPFLPAGATLLPGYGRMQGIAYRRGDGRFEGRSVTEAVDAACRGGDCHLVNRNRGSGTRILIDRLLAGRRPPGYAVEARSHNAVAAALQQGRADWGVLIAPVAAAYELAFLPLSEERFDFVIPDHRWDRPAVAAFRELLTTPEVRGRLARAGFHLDPETTP